MNQVRWPTTVSYTHLSALVADEVWKSSGQSPWQHRVSGESGKKRYPSGPAVDNGVNSINFYVGVVALQQLFFLVLTGRKRKNARSKV